MSKVKKSSIDDLLIKRSDIEVSIIVPMYNVESLIADTIHSIKNNACSFEVLLINDGSTDNTLDEAYLAVDKDPRFTIINQKNQGVSAARNIGLAKAKGNFIVFLDSDDLLLDRALDVMVSTAYEKNADFVYGAIKKYDGTKSWFLPSHLRNNVFKPGYKNIIDNPEVLFFIGVAGKLIHHTILKDANFPVGIKFSEDTVVIFQSFLNAKNIYTVADVVYYYRERNEFESKLSATQTLKQNAYIYLNNIFDTILLCKESVDSDKKLSDREKLIFLKKYYDRIFSYELWPLLYNCLKYDKKNNAKALNKLLVFLKKHSTDEINNYPAVRLYLIKVLIDYVFIIDIKSFSTYRQLLYFLISSLKPEIKKLCAQEAYYGKKWSDSYQIASENKALAFLFFLRLRVIKKFNWNVKNNNDFVINYFFNLFKLLPVNRKKIVFATTNKKPMRQNFTFVLNELHKSADLKNYKIYKFLGKANTVKKIIYRYYHLATAKVVFLEDYYNPIYNSTFSKNTKVVQLWHACGAYKKFGKDTIGRNDSNSVFLETIAHKAYTDIIVSSNEIRSNYSTAFNTSLEKVLPLGVPRTDLFFDYSKMGKIVSNIKKWYPYLIDTYNILYAPTFRGRPGNRNKQVLYIDWNELKRLPKYYKVIIKLHPVVEKITPEIPLWIKDRVLLLDSKEDINEWLIFCDLLITDYSSIIFEYSLLQKPIVYFPYDINDYLEERGFYYPYKDYIYGDVVYNTGDLIKSILVADKKMYDYLSDRKDFLRKFMGACDGKSSKRIIDYFILK